MKTFLLLACFNLFVLVFVLQFKMPTNILAFAGLMLACDLGLLAIAQYFERDKDED